MTTISAHGEHDLRAAYLMLLKQSLTDTIHCLTCSMDGNNIVANPAITAHPRMSGRSFSFAWRSLMGAELILVVKAHGLGFLLQTGRDFSQVEQVIAVMIVMVVIGMLADRWVFAPIQRVIQTRFGLS